MSNAGTVPPEAPMSVVELGRRSITYALGGLAYKGIALLTVPLLARLLSPTELGLLDLAAVLASVIGLIAVLGTDQGVAYLEPRVERAAGVWTSALIIVALVAGSALLLSLLLGDAVAEWLVGPGAPGWLITVAALYGAVLALTATALNAMRLHATPRAYAWASFALVTAEMAAALLIAWQLESPVVLMVVGWAVAAGVIAVPLLLRYVPTFTAPRATTVRRLARFGAPLVPAAAAWLAGDAWIRGTLAQRGDLEALGEYGIAFRIASVVVLAVTGFAVAWQPYIFRSPRELVHGRASTLFVHVVLALGLLAAALTALAPEVVLIVGGEPYAGARVAVAPLAAGAVALGAFTLIGAVIASSGSTRMVAVAAILGAGAQVLAAPWLIDALGLVGAGMASLAGYAVALIIVVAREPALLRPPAGIEVGVASAIVVVGLLVASSVDEWSIAWRAVVVAGLALVSAAVALAVQGRRKAVGA